MASLQQSDTLPFEEALLVRQAQEGDRQAFARLIERYWERLHRWMYHLAHHRQTAEDLTQETFLKALAGLKTFRAGTNFHAWLFRIGHNCFVNHRRAASRIREALPEELPGNGREPHEQAEEREALQRLGQAVRRLPAEFRSAFLLRVEEDLSFREIAEVLGLTEETARWRVFKARQKLLRVLAPQREQEKS